ncbi:MAG: hypothetical protein WC742_01555 [Gallionellaceae bacterium]|jgi:hypothetical protein
MSIVENILLHSLLNFLMLGSVIGLIAGGILIFRPHWLNYANVISGSWISTRKLNHSIERSIEFDRWFYQHRQFTGTIILIGAVYLLYFFGIQFDKPAVIIGLSRQFQVPTAYIDLLIDPLVLIALMGATFALLVSLFVLFRPSQIREFERIANKWISMRKTLKPLEISRKGVDEFAMRHSQKVGIILIMGSLYSLVIFTFFAG